MLRRSVFGERISGTLDNPEKILSSRVADEACYFSAVIHEHEGGRRRYWLRENDSGRGVGNINNPKRKHTACRALTEIRRNFLLEDSANFAMFGTKSDQFRRHHTSRQERRQDQKCHGYTL